MSNPDHPTEELIIKCGLVDKGIIPLVKYLNSFMGIWTVWSCEGDEDSQQVVYDSVQDLADVADDRAMPYVAFMAEDLASLRCLLETITELPLQVIIESHSEFMPFRFLIRFESKSALEYCQSKIEATSITQGR